MGRSGGELRSAGTIRPGGSGLSAVVKLTGDTASLLNNEGYSYMLRGDLKKADALLDRALKLDPANETTLNNRKLLNSSTRFVERAPDGEPCGSVPCAH